MYIVIEIQNGTVGSNKWEFRDPNKTDEENRLEALSKWHSVLSVASTSSVAYHACIVVRYDGTLIASQGYKHIQPTPEVE